MAPCRQLLMWSVPSIAVLLGLFWFRKKRELAGSDPGGREKLRSLQEELAEALKVKAEARNGSPTPSIERVIAKSAPINIVSNGTKSQRSSPLTDEEIDIEIDNIIRKKSLDKRASSVVSQKSRDKSELSADSFVKDGPTVFSSVCRTPLKQTPAGDPGMASIPVHQQIQTPVQTHALCSASPKQSSYKEDLIQRVMTKIEASTCDDINLIDSKNSLKMSELKDNPNDIKEAVHVSDENDSNKCPAEQMCISERDSANHSPVDPMLASPSMCHFSDNHSEGSSDSGKGCSEAASPPPANMNLATAESNLRIHQFVIPQALVGLLIGKHGAFVMQVKARTGANIFVKRHPDSIKMKICAVEGSQSEIEAALDMIRRKFPEKRFPNFSLQEISAELFQKLIPLVPEFLQLQLVESVNNETIMTCLVTAGHFFLQQPLHPTFPSLHALHHLMAATYQNPDVPDLPRPVKEGSICAAPTENNWYRAQVISTIEENDTSVVKLVDFGGYLTVDNAQLKQIRSDFMTLPFQATEALLAFVKPANNGEEWSGESLRIMAGLTAGQLLHAQVAGYDEAGVPLVNLYLTIGAQQVIFLNSELVKRGLAEWDMPIES